MVIDGIFSNHPTETYITFQVKWCAVCYIIFVLRVANFLGNIAVNCQRERSKLWKGLLDLLLWLVHASDLPLAYLLCFSFANTSQLVQLEKDLSSDKTSVKVHVERLDHYPSTKMLDGLWNEFQAVGEICHWLNLPLAQRNGMALLHHW